MNKDIHKTWGIVTLLFWSPMILFYLAYPPSTWRMIEWLYYVGVLIVLAGILSGVLLLVYPRVGRLLALTLSAILLVVKFYQIGSAYPHIGERLYANYVVFMKVKTIQVIYNDILGVIFFISTLCIFIIRNSQTD
jgi:hypothetical protein